MNELSIIFDRLEIDTNSVLEAAGTKWNFLPFRPGLVGGHCICVDPYYLTYKASQVGYTSKVILSGRKINDDMGKHVVGHLIKTMIKNQIDVSNAKVGILGFTFKENCPDTRNTRVIDIVNELSEYNVKSVIVDPIADEDEAFQEYNLKLNQETELTELSAIIIAVAHDEFSTWKNKFNDFFKRGNLKFIYDLKALYDFEDFESNDTIYWRL
jgi:UDP-N-acetyl-D-galactosamine dehydrogenase